MKTSFLLSLILSFSSIIPFTIARAQSEDSIAASKNLPYNKTLTIVYDLKIEGIKKTGIEEVYNGGNKTIFINNEKIRVRLVSLMRIESIFFNLTADTANNHVTIVKESGKDRYKNKLLWSEWKLYNSKYAGVHCQLDKDTRTILDYPCKKATLKLLDGKEIIVYYTTQFYNPLLIEADPLFALVPGLVLQYQYKRKGKSITYTASQLSENKISKNLFFIPGKDYPIKSFKL